MQQFLKTPPGVAWTRIVAAKFFDQFLVAVDDAPSTFDLCFGRIALASFTRPFKSRPIPHNRDCVAWDTFLSTGVLML